MMLEKLARQLQYLDSIGGKHIKFSEYYDCYSYCLTVRDIIIDDVVPEALYYPTYTIWMKNCNEAIITAQLAKNI